MLFVQVIYFWSIGIKDENISEYRTFAEFSVNAEIEKRCQVGRSWKDAYYYILPDNYLNSEHRLLS